PLRAAFCGRGTQTSPLQRPSDFCAHPVRASNVLASTSNDVRIIDVPPDALSATRNRPSRTIVSRRAAVMREQTTLKLYHFVRTGGARLDYNLPRHDLRDANEAAAAAAASVQLGWRQSARSCNRSDRNEGMRAHER